MRRVALSALVALLCLAAPAAAGGPSHLVDASPTAEGQVLHRADVQIVRTGGETVDPENLAKANPHDCTGCEGIAVAFQAVIYKGSPDTVAPKNVAAAVNSNCTRCGAFAYAYQYVVGSDGRLTAEAREEIRAIEDEARQAVDAGLTYPELDAKLHDLADRFKSAVDDGLVAQHGGRDAERHDAQAPQE